MDPRPDIPDFWQRLVALFRDSVSHAFILHGNVHDDYVAIGAAYQELETFLLSRVSASHYDIIALVDPAQGLTFPIPTHRDLAYKLLGAPAGGLLAQILGAAPPNAPNAPKQVIKPAFALRDITQVLDALLTTPLTIENPGAPDRPARVAVLFQYSDFLFPDAELSQSDGPTLTRLLRWSRSSQVADVRHLLIMVAESLLALHSELRRASARWEQIAIPLPDAREREQFIAARLQDYPELTLDDDLTARAIAQATGALTRKQVEDVIFRGLGDERLTYRLITDRKQEIISQEFADVLQVLDPRFSLEAVGGYEYLKDFFRQRVIRPWRERKLTVGGILLSGPPGTGKTQLAEALAGSANMPFVVFALSKILGQFVGNSERNLDRALQAILSLSPCILFIDELDQVMGRGEQAVNQVDNRVFARLLNFLEDPGRMGKVLLVASTNRPDLLDPALRSRFDRTAPVLPPTGLDRARILQILALNMGLVDLKDDLYEDDLYGAELSEVVAATDGWTGRNLRDLMRVAVELRDDDGLQAPTALRLALDIYQPPILINHEMTRLALAEISDLRLVPPEYRQQAQQARETSQEPLQAPRRRARRGGDLL